MLTTPVLTQRSHAEPAPQEPDDDMAAAAERIDEIIATTALADAKRNLAVAVEAVADALAALDRMAPR